MRTEEAQILQSIRREQRNAEWINGSMSKLRKEFGDRYVAVKNRKVIDSDKDFDGLLARIRSMKDPEAVTIEFITAEECIWIL